jgi:hypothetical protein
MPPISEMKWFTQEKIPAHPDFPSSCPILSIRVEETAAQWRSPNYYAAEPAAWLGCGGGVGTENYRQR